MTGMEVFAWGACAVCVCLLAALVKRGSKETALLMTATAAAVLLLGALGKAQPLFRQLEGFSGQSGLPGECFAVLLKAVGIGLGGQFTGQLCRDGGENSLAWGVELAAKLGILWAALPLFQQLLQWLDTLLRM